ncbi:hypothetical protein JCM10207_003907 [Rhodosporidiobolus poonsookiae]
MSLSDSDVDFDDPRFLVDAPQEHPSSLSYAERRKRKVIAQEDRGRTKSRKQEEVERREEGLRTNLIANDTETGGESKALKMMKMMGFKPGEALGKKQDEPEATGSAPVPASAKGGLGFSRASFAPIGQADSVSTPSAPPPAEKARTEPIKFRMREARTGLGVPQPHKLRAFPSHLLPNNASASDPLPDLEGYLAHIKSSMDAKRAWGLLRSLRRTCEELDRRAGIDDSVMWRDPDEEEREEQRTKRRRLFDRLDGELDSDDERKAEQVAERRKQKRRETELAYETGQSETVVDPDDDDQGATEGQGGADADEEAEWMAMDVQTRLGLTLAYLRSKYHYCFWCGCQYTDEQDMATSCPGKEEADH